MMQLLVHGSAPLELAPSWVAAQRCMLFPKASGDVRPIAVGECLRRLASKCLCRAVREAAREYLSPMQLGVAMPNGSEAAVHHS